MVRSCDSARGNQPLAYEIKVQGILDESWSEWLGGLAIMQGAGDPSTTLLTGVVTDQAALHGLLQKIRDIHLPLLSLNLIEMGSESGS